MEGVGARSGRSSARYGPATVFTGPVRKWKKKWVHAPPSISNNHHSIAVNGAVNGSNGSSHLFFYKWIPITASQNKESNNNNNGGNNSDHANADPTISNKNDAVASEEPPRRKFKYIPIAVLYEQNNESSEQIEDEAKPIEIEANTDEATSKSDGNDEKPPDINDVPVDESQSPENDPVERQDLNESTLDLSLGLKTHEREIESDQKDDRDEDNQLE